MQKVIGISLKPLTPYDVSDKYVSWLNDDDVVRFTEQRNRTHTYNDICRFVESKLESDTEFLFGIYSGETHVGNIKLGPIDYRHATADISYLVGEKDLWNQGIATKAITLAVDEGVKKFNLEKITAGCYINNIASIRALEKNRFLTEGIRKKQVQFEGERIDTVVFGLVA